MRRNLFTLILLFSPNSFSNNCFPESSLEFPLMKSSDASLEMQIDQQVQHFTRVMKSFVKKQMKKELIVKLDWGSPRVNASATRDDENNPVIILLGGMARHPQLTSDGLYGILCHELGHHLGGAPKKKRGRSEKRSWSSAEGQADYFTTKICLPLLFKKPRKSVNPSDFAEKKEVDYITRFCAENYECIRMGLAGLSMARVFASIKGHYDLPSLESEDQYEAWETELGHPQPQCRLDTLKLGLHGGKRPRCWYKNEIAD